METFIRANIIAIDRNTLVLLHSNINENKHVLLNAKRMYHSCQSEFRKMLYEFSHLIHVAVSLQHSSMR